jgi:hypothetical protein
MIRAQATAALFFTAAAAWALGQDAERAAAATDLTLILRTWRVKGAMACPETCLWVENAFPVGIFEVVRRPFGSAIREFDAALAQLRRLAPRSTSSHTGPSDNSDSTLQFAEAHVYEFVYPIDANVIARPERGGMGVSYLSELDPLAWRSPVPDLLLHGAASATLCDLPPRPPRVCAGSWGNYYPRHGFVVRDSEVVAAYLQALRAGRAAADPRGRVVLAPYPFEPRTGHWIQMIDPVARAPVKIGSGDLTALERGALARDGGYAFVHFGLFERCAGCLPGRLLPER